MKDSVCIYHSCHDMMGTVSAKIDENLQIDGIDLCEINEGIISFYFAIDKIDYDYNLSFLRQISDTVDDQVSFYVGCSNFLRMKFDGEYPIEDTKNYGSLYVSEAFKCLKELFDIDIKDIASLYQVEPSFFDAESMRLVIGNWQ